MGCWVKSCPRAYHFACALHNKIRFKFTSDFPTYCSKHAVNRKKKPKIEGKCGICLSSVKKTEHLILIPCCNNWFHHKCLQKFAFSSGSCFKCPLCNDKDKCCERLPELGVFLPEKDCDWELSGIIFQETLENEDRACDANCWRLDLPIFREAPSLWKICTVCGSSAIHQECLSDGFNGEFICRSCDDILNRPKAPHSTPVVPVTLSPVNFLASATPTQSTVPVTHAATFTQDVLLDQALTLAQTATVTPVQPTVTRSPRKPSKFRKFSPWFSDDEVCSSSDEGKSAKFRIMSRNYSLLFQKINHRRQRHAKKPHQNAANSPSIKRLVVNFTKNLCRCKSIKMFTIK